MKIKSIQINDFGKFHNLDTIGDLNNGIVLIYGENEAGKTTLFELIKTLFYGFKPATKDKNPNTSWRTNKIEFTCHLEMDSGEKVEVHRKLLSTPSGKTIKNDESEEIKNYTIRQATHISSEIYNKIFALRVEDLSDIKGDAWSEIQEKLLANFGSEDLLSVREVVKRINDESDLLYRKSKRGNQFIRDLKTKLVKLKQTRKIVRESDKEIRDFDSEINWIKNELAELEVKRISLKVFVNKAKEIMPVRKIINAIKSLGERLVQKDVWDTMKNQDTEKYLALKDKIEELRTELQRVEKSLKIQEDKISHFTDEDSSIYKNRVLIKTFKSEFDDIKQLRREIRLAEEERIRLEKKIERKWDSISNVELEDEVREKIQRINVNELSILINRLVELKREVTNKQDSYKKIKKQVEEEELTKKNTDVGFIIKTILILGVIITMVGSFLVNTIIVICGIVILFFSLGALFVKADIRKKQTSNKTISNQLVDLTIEMNELIEQTQNANKELDELLGGMPVSEAVMEGQTEIFIASFMSIKDTMSEINSKKEEVTEKENKVNELNNELNEFLNIFKYQNAIKEEEKLFELSSRVKESEKKIVSNEAIARRIEELKEEIADKKTYLENQEKIVMGVEEKLREMGNGELEKGIENCINNTEVKQRIDFYENELSKIPGFEKMIEEINLCSDDALYNDGLEFSDYELEKAESEIENIIEKVTSLIESKKEKEMKMGRLLEEKTLDEVESEIFMNEEELNSAYIRYDKLLLMKEIINIADEQFKEENQPDVLKNASSYLQKMTHNRYSHIMVEESDGEVASLLVKNNDLNKRIEATEDQLSKGTLHQLYLSLRMSLIDHLDKDNEKLPICFDELLVNWDDSRLDNSLELLKEVSNKRQVFMFTCHDWLATKIEEALDVRRIDIAKQGE